MHKETCLAPFRRTYIVGTGCVSVAREVPAMPASRQTTNLPVDSSPRRVAQRRACAMEVGVDRNADNLTSSTWVSGRRASRSVPTRGSVHLWHGTAKPGRTDVDDADLPLSDDELTRAH